MILPFFDYPPEIRKVIYTTNAIESVDMSLRNISKKQTMPIKNSKAALTRFTIQFDDQMNGLVQKPHLHRTLDTL